ncbi:hypothetical protein INR49_010230 [Caranx melampygus]|nr:hypothetical protein INR49_010230 [Caranx melampygus]
MSVLQQATVGVTCPVAFFGVSYADLPDWLLSVRVSRELGPVPMKLHTVAGWFNEEPPTGGNPCRRQWVWHIQIPKLAGALHRRACSLGTATLPAIRPTSLLLYRTESSVSTILDGSSCFMLFHQSAAEETKRIWQPSSSNLSAILWCHEIDLQPLMLVVLRRSPGQPGLLEACS